MSVYLTFEENVDGRMFINVWSNAQAARAQIERLARTSGYQIVRDSGEYITCKAKDGTTVGLWYEPATVRDTFPPVKGVA